MAGNSTDLSAQVSAAAADGARAAQHINADLIMEDANRAVAALAGEGRPMTHGSDHEFDKEYWEQHWQRGRTGSPGSMGGNPPNPYLAREISDLVPEHGAAARRYRCLTSGARWW